MCWVVNFKVPINAPYDYKRDEIPVEINGEIMGVSFKTWLEKIFQTSVDNLFGYWLTSKDSCIALYTDTLDDEITELTLPMDYLILSDLSVDGCLIVTNQPKSDNENVQTKFVKDI